jgi:eukaryotic-like serine/threonine-protein kinase
MGLNLIGRYEVLAPLGAGGMGEVFLARDTQLPRKVAIKRVRAGGRPGSERQILREARTVALLSHPSIAAIFDILEHDGALHIVMEYIEGETLGAKLRRGPLPESEALGYVRQIADALTYAHAQGVIHCDIKPSNVMIAPDGRARVLDFGIARFEATLQSEAEKTTTAHVVRGTPLYMAPELLLGGTPNARSDVYSVGVVLFELLTARRPYEGLSPVKLLASGAPSPSISVIAPGVSRALSDLVARAIAVDPQQRLATVSELKTGLDTVAATVSQPAAQRDLSFAWRWAAPGAALLAVSIALLSGIPSYGGRARSTQPTVMGVMVFNTTGDKANDHLGAGLSDSLTASLAGAQGITAVARSALTRFDEMRDVPDAVRDLGLTHTITGSLQRSGSAVRFTMNLIDAKQSVLWSNTFDGTEQDIFHLEQRVSEGTLKALRMLGFVGADVVAQAHERPPTSSAEGFDAYSNGRILLDRADVPGNLDRALGLFEQAVTLDAKFVRAHAAIGEAAWLKYRTTKDVAWIDRARTSTIEALRLAPDDPSVRYALAVIEHGTGHSDRAIAELETVLKGQPASDDAHRLLGRIYSEKSDFTRAIDEFREALNIRPQYPANVRALGLAYYDAARLPEAIAQFTKLTAMQPDNSSAFQMLGTAYHAAGQFDQAVVAYERSNALAPKAKSFGNIGILYHARRDYPRAIAAHRESIRLAPKEATTHRNLADTLWAAGDRAAARASYQKAIDLARESLAVNAADAKMHALVAFCEAKLAHAQAADRAMKEAVRLAPDDNDVVYKQAVIESLRGNYDAALRLLRRALDLGYPQTMLPADRDLDPLRPLAGFPAAPAGS